jgi:polyhydroxybutyrate depolymerase
MVWHLRLIQVLVLVVAGLAATDGSAQTLMVSHQGTTRTAVLYRPATAVGPVALVIALHGLGGTGANFRTWFHLDAVAAREGFAVVYPDAIDKRWSYGRPIIGPMPVVNGETVDDIGFLGALIDELVKRRIADPVRVYVTGMSRGALMTFTVACALSDRVAAAAPIASGMTDHQREDCRPSRPVPFVVIAGTEDHAQKYDGWIYPRGRLLSIPESLEYLRVLHRCREQSDHPLPQRDPRNPTRVVLVEWDACASGAQLRFYRIEGGGHQIPSIIAADSPLSRERFGRRNHDIEAAEEIWKFFKLYSR